VRWLPGKDSNLD